MIVRATMIRCDECGHWTRADENEMSRKPQESGWCVSLTGVGWNHLCPSCAERGASGGPLTVSRTQRPVQGAREIYGGRRSTTELARVVAEHEGWWFDQEGRIVDRVDGRLVAASIEEAADAMWARGWFAESGGIRWPEIRAAGDTARLVREAVQVLEGLENYP